MHHLKSACCSIGDGTVLINREWIDAAGFAEYRMIDVAEEWSSGCSCGSAIRS